MKNIPINASMKNFQISLLLLLNLIVISAFTQVNERIKKFEFSWNSPVEYELQEEKMQKTLNFIGAQYELSRNNLPFLYNEVHNSHSQQLLSAKVIATDFVVLEQSELELINTDSIASEILPIVSNSIVRKKHVSFLKFYPFRKNPTTGQVEKLKNIELEFQYTKASSARSKSNVYASNSVLGSGDWYKIGVMNSNVYELSYHFLKNLGMDVDKIDPRNIRIYGNGGGKLPELNSEQRPDDLLECAIYIEGESDGKFGPSDKIYFYAEGPIEWKFDQAKNVYRHYNNQYTDTNFYFISSSLGKGKRIEQRTDNMELPATQRINSFLDYQHYEQDKYNLIKSGYEWVGDVYDQKTNYKYFFNFPNILVDSNSWIRFHGFARSAVPSKFDLNIAGQSFSISALPTDIGNYLSHYAKTALSEFNIKPNSDLVEMDVNYNKPMSSSSAWLNYIEINAWRKLNFSSGQMSFRNIYANKASEVYEFAIKGASGKLKIWDVSEHNEVVQQKYDLQQDVGIFRLNNTSKINEFVVFSQGDTTMFALGKIPNQDLHALSFIDMAIVSHPNFFAQARQLENLHTNNGLRVVVVSPQQIYNEFSSGKQDPVAIRTFMKMFYDRSVDADDMPSYLLLFGDASYDLKNKINGNTNFVISYQSKEFLHPLYSYVSDDYFGFLDDSEGLWLNNTKDKLDLGIGRLPVQTPQEAQDMLNKIGRYSSPQAMSEWRNELVFIGDDEDSNLHNYQANSLANSIESTNKEFNTNKILLDAFQQQSTPGGHRYPDVNRAINQKIEQGALLVNYTGHGGETGLAHERVVTINDIVNWKNTNKLPLVVTATCELSRYDDPNRVSAGEMMLLNKDGGAIGMMTTTRTAFAIPNFQLSQTLYSMLFERIDGKQQSMGEVYRKVKVARFNDGNARNFSYLGDPAIKLSVPEHRVIVTSINGKAISQMDTLKALSKVEVKGYLADYLTSQKMQDFNGTLYSTVFDKQRTVNTLNNDGNGVFTYKARDSKVFKGKASVVEGEFSFSFVVPKDISYNIGTGKISFYAENSLIDAGGYTMDFKIGGSSDSALSDNEGPQIELYMNDQSFVYGGMTDENPILKANLTDDLGINTVGNGIGHDIILILDGNSENTVVLNEYYEAEMDSYQKGSIAYKLNNLSEGKHTLTLKAWDVSNNSAESTIEFTVVKEKDIEIDKVLNYPNPFTSSTEFWFEHNQPGVPLDVKVQIFTVSGKLVKSIDQLVVSEGFRVDNIKWDGLDDYGDKIGRGVYLYKLKVRSRNGTMAEKIEKLVIL